MTVKDLFVRLQGANYIQFTTDTAEKYQLEDKRYCRADFWHKFRRTEIWNSEITLLYTTAEPQMNSFITILTIDLTK